MRKFSIINESIEFKGRGNLKSVLNSLIEQIDIYQESKDFFNEYLTFFLFGDSGGTDEQIQEYFQDLDDPNELGAFNRRNRNEDYEGLREHIYKKYKKNIDNMDSLFLDVIYLFNVLSELDKKKADSFKKFNT